MLTFRLTWGRPLSEDTWPTLDAQSVWKELSEHMRTSSKEASEKRRLTQYVTNTVLYDNFKGTAEQFVLHFNEQFRQLDEISQDSEKLPPTVKLTVLQTAVRSINDLRIVETLDEFQSTTYGHGSTTSLSYETYYDLLINACVRYDKTKKGNIGKRRNVYNTNIDDTYVDHPTACIDHVPDSPYGGIDLPPDEFYQVHTLSSRHPPSPILMSFTRYISFPLGTHLLQGLVILPDLPLGHNLKLLGLTSQLEGMMVLSSCLLCQVPCPQDSTMIPERTINHHFTYHVAQASQTKHGSLVDRGANGGLA